MLGDKDLIILSEGILCVEKIVVEPHTSLSNVEHLFVENITHDCLPRIDAHRWEAFCLSLKKAIGAGGKGVNISGYLERLREDKTLCSLDLKLWMFCSKHTKSIVQCFSKLRGLRRVLYLRFV